MKLNTSAVTTIQPPHRTSAARVTLVRGARRVNQSPATSPTSAAGSSQDTSEPKLAPNIRPIPDAPPNPVLPPPARPPPPPPPWPNNRPRPL